MNIRQLPDNTSPEEETNEKDGVGRGSFPLLIAYEVPLGHNRNRLRHPFPLGCFELADVLQFARGLVRTSVEGGASPRWHSGGEHRHQRQERSWQPGRRRYQEVPDLRAAVLPDMQR